MKILSLICLILVLLLTSVECGRILSGDLSVDYANAGKMTKLSFSFMLENSIDESDYVKVALPFPLHSQLVPAYPAKQGLSLPSGLVLTYQLMDNSANVLSTTYSGQILTETIDSSNYFIRFYSTGRKTFIPMIANQWYFITFEIQQTDPLKYQKASSILQIQLSTVSSVWSNAMVYDDNLAFNYFSLAPTPSQTITLSVSQYNSGAPGGYLLTQNQYSLYLDVNLNIPSYQYSENLVLKFLVSTKKTFKWTGVCSSVAKTNAPVINQVNASLYTCVIDTVENAVVVTLSPAALALQTAFRFTADIINPPIVVTNKSIEVRAVKVNSGVIIGYGIATNVLSTNQIYVTYQEIFVGWGLRPDALLPFNARIFRGNAPIPTYMPYNSLTLKFSVSQSTSPAIELKVVINIPSESDAFVLQNAFTTNLPAAPNKIVKCVTQYATTGSNRTIGCTGVGALTNGTVYQIGWKMFFPYNNYEAPIDCTQFGTLTIYTTQMISVEDNAFFLGRGNDFLTFLKSSPDFIVLGRNSSYITYMRTFLNLNLVVSSEDFQQFLKYPQNIYITNRPQNYSNKEFSEVYVIRQNLAFMTYISLFQDIFIAAKLKSNTDIVKGYDTYPLLAKSMPKNTLTLLTSNSKDWTDLMSPNVPLVSSVSGTSGTYTPGTGLQTGPSQSLVFKFRAPFEDVSSFSTIPSTKITNNWGMMIMMSPKIKFNAISAPVILQDSITTMSSVTAQTVSSSSSYNQYTLITIRGSTSGNLQTTFHTNATIATKTIGLYPFDIDAFSSIYADSDNMDIMIATCDGIDGPTNKIKFNGFFLINSFSMLTAALGTINYGFVNYEYANPMDGSKVPTMLRVQGSIADNNNFDSLAIFFDKLTPFYTNYYTGDVFCESTEGTPYCKFKKGYEIAPNIYNYQTLSRIQVPMANPSSPFNIFIPVTFVPSQTTTNLYIGYQKIDPVTGDKSLVYIEPMRSVTINAASTAAGNYGPDVTSTYVGQNFTNLQIKANIASPITVNSATSLGAAFSYFSQWDYIKSSTITGWQSYGMCYQMRYLYYNTNYFAYLNGISFAYSYKMINGVVCPLDMAGMSTGSAALTLSVGYLPAKWGKIFPGYGAYSQNNGQLLYINPNQAIIPQDLLISGTIILPPAGPLLIKQVAQFIIPLPASLDGNTQVSITGASGTTNVPFISSSSGTCSIFNSVRRLPISCTISSSPTLLQYTLIINEQGLLPAYDSLIIVHYGLTTNSSYNTVTVDITVSSLLNNPTPLPNDLIFKKSAVPFAWQGSNYIGISTLALNSFNQWTKNKATYEEFNFSFTLLSKGLYDTNRIRFDLGQFAIDNSAALMTPTCKVFNYDNLNDSKSFSHDWAAVDYSQGLSKLQIWPQRHLIGNNLTYLVRCFNFISTSSQNPLPIKAIVVNTSSDLTGQLSTSSTNSITLPVLNPTTVSGKITLTKSYTIPSTVMDMFFQILSPGITADSYLYLNFPSYYSDGLGPDVKCYSTYEIYCFVKGRTLTVRYIGEYSAGTTFTLTVSGVSKSINYNAGIFSYVFDNDDNPTTILTSGTFIDSAASNALSVQNFSTFPILALNQSSYYLREQDVTITADFYLPTTLSSIGVGQSLMIVFPPIYFDVLRFVTPTCTLNIKGNTLKNYISSCYFVGMRLKMYFLDFILTGTTYSLTIGGLINPTNPSSNVQKYSFEISNSGDTSIIAKTYSPNCNFLMPIFVVNPARKSLNYYTASNGLINTLSTMQNIQSQEVFISPMPDYVNSFYERNVYLQPFNNLYSNPTNIELLSGSNPFPIKFSSLTSGVNYVYFSKSGDGSFYSNLPPLVLTINKNYNTALSFVETQYKLPVNVVGTNYAISITLPKSLYPMSQVSMTVSLSSYVGLSPITNLTTISFYPTQGTAYINLYINDSTLWTVGKTTNLIITPMDSTYTGGVSIPLYAVAAASGSAAFSLTTGTISKKWATFSMTCSEEGHVVYHISRYFSYNTTACTLDIPTIRAWSAEPSIDGLRVSETYYDCQDQITVVNVAKGVASSITVTGLQASYAYTIQAFCETQAGVQSNMITSQFNTVSNTGSVSQMTFYFDSKLTASQKIKLVCSLALYFNLDYKRVSTWDGYYCSQLLSRRLQQIPDQSQIHYNSVAQPPPSSKNLITNNLYSPFDQMIPSLLARQLSTTMYGTLVFFGINNNLLNDATRGQIVPQSSLLNLQNELNINVTGLPYLYNYSLDTLSYIGPNDISNMGSFRIDAGPSYLFVEGIMMNNNGLIYFIVGDPNLWPRAPLVSEIKMGSGPDGLPPAYFRILAYNTNDPTSSYMAWTTMAQGTFDLYIMVSDSNPFDTANLGQINKFTFTYETPNWSHLLKPLGWLVIIILFVLMH